MSSPPNRPWNKDLSASGLLGRWSQQDRRGVVKRDRGWKEINTKQDNVQEITVRNWGSIHWEPLSEEIIPQSYNMWRMRQPVFIIQLPLSLSEGYS